MTTEAIRSRFPWGLTIVCTLAFILLVLLGVWQVQRMQWKEGLIAEAGAAAKHPPVPLPSGQRTDLPEFQTVILDCDFQASQRVELQTIQDGVPGVRLISGCGGRLVDLGFISEEISARPPFTQYRAPRLSGSYPTIIAEVRNTPAPNSFALPPEKGRFFARDNRAIAAILGVPPDRASQTLYAVTSAFPGFGALQPVAPPPAFSNNHLGYALTWFGLALALAGFYIALLRRKLTS
ncbi:SURF1 family protein [Brevundimonas sp.]|uniref:SURF1 family protein n=1 Tax=Brevundimonas sp. TaxID=1871086 RepID=UPI003562998A